MLHRDRTTLPNTNRVYRALHGRKVARPSLANATREAWEVSTPGSLVGSLRLRKDVALTPLAKDSVRVDVKCVGLNFADVFTVLGLYGATPKNETFIPGLEFSGVCVEGDESVLGKRVMGVTRFGAFASVVDVPKHQVRVIPDEWSFQEGASFIVQSLTVYYLSLIHI